MAKHWDSFLSYCMCPGLGKLIRSQALSYCTINKPHDMSALPHSPSPDQLPLLCTPFSFATYHTIYGTHSTTSAPTIAFVLISPVHTDKGGWTEYTPPYTSHFVPLHHTHACTSPHTHTYTPPSPLLSYLFTPLALSSGCIQLDSALFHPFSPVIADTPITLHTPACLLMFMLTLHLCSLALCTHT